VLTVEGRKAEKHQREFLRESRHGPSSGSSALADCVQVKGAAFDNGQKLFIGKGKHPEQNSRGDVRCPGAIARRTTAPVADSQRSTDLLLFTLALARIAKGDGCRPQRSAHISNAMDDPYDLVLGMFALAIAAVMLVAGEIYLVTRPDPPETVTPPPSVITSSIK
jgi:hypothetical protein